MFWRKERVGFKIEDGIVWHRGGILPYPGPLWFQPVAGLITVVVYGTMWFYVGSLLLNFFGFI